MNYYCKAVLVVSTYNIVLLTVLFGLFLGPFKCLGEENKTCFGKAQMGQLLSNSQTWATISSTCDLEMLIEHNEKIQIRKSDYDLAQDDPSCNDLIVGNMYPVVKDENLFSDDFDYELAFDSYEFNNHVTTVKGGFLAVTIIFAIVSIILIITSSIVLHCVKRSKDSSTDVYQNETGENPDYVCSTRCQIGSNVTFILLSLFFLLLIIGMGLKMGPYNCLGEKNPLCFNKAERARLVNNYPSTPSICYLEFRFTDTGIKFVILRDNIGVQPDAPECYDLEVGTTFLVTRKDDGNYMLASDDIDLWLLTDKIRYQCWAAILASLFFFLSFVGIGLGVSKFFTRWTNT